MIKGKKIGGIKPSKTPKMSVNKLAEYMEANPSRRKKIVNDAKYPEPFITTRYKDAREIAKSYLNGDINDTQVLKEIGKFERAAIAAAKIPNNDFQVQDNQLSADALGLLLDTELPDLTGAKVETFNEPNKKVIIRGVAISIYPDLIIKKGGAGIINVGIIKLHFIKNFQLSDESQKIVSVMLSEYARKYVINPSKNEVVNNKLCFSVDIFKQQFVECPSSVKMRLKKVEDACEEIALWWDSL